MTTLWELREQASKESERILAEVLGPPAYETSKVLKDQEHWEKIRKVFRSDVYTVALLMAMETSRKDFDFAKEFETIVDALSNQLLPGLLLAYKLGQEDGKRQ